MKKTSENLIYDEMSERIIEVVREMVISEGTQNINVRRVLKHLNITNRVFYNRFHNIEEVLDIIANNSMMKIRDGLLLPFDKNRDFFEQVMDIVEKTLRMTYDTRMEFAYYVFENDTSSDNYEWWRRQIKKILEYAIENGYMKKTDTDMASYAIWCFIRGFNVDAIGRKLPIEEAVKIYRYGFKFVLDGLKAD